MLGPEAIIGGYVKDEIATIDRASERRGVAEIARDGLDLELVDLTLRPAERTNAMATLEE